jgi:hypothetical protein
VKPSSSIVAFALMMSCGPAQKPTAPAPVEAMPVVAAPEPAPAAPAMPSKRDAAAAEVARLTALADKDPFLMAWTGPYGGIPPWDKLKVEAFPRAFETGLALELAEVDVIAENPEPATFANTFAPLEDGGRHVGRAETLFSIMTGNLSTPEIQAVDKEWSPKMAATRDKITFNDQLFARVTAVYAARDQLTAEQRRLVELRYDRFVKAGAKLSAAIRRRSARSTRSSRACLPSSARRCWPTRTRGSSSATRTWTGCRHSSRRRTRRRRPSESSTASGPW